MSSLRVDAFRERNLASARREALEAEKAVIRTAELIKASNEDIARSRIELFSFLGLLIFIAVTTSNITDRVLLVGSRTKFPLLDVTIGIDQFLLVSPFVILGVHFALLLKFDQLRNKCREIDRQLNELAHAGQAHAARDLSLLVGTNFLAQWIVGLGRDRFYRRLNFAVYMLAVAIAPVIVLVLITVRTLPLHQEPWTMVQNGLLCSDLWLLVYFHAGRRHPKTRASVSAALFLIFANLLFCVPDSCFDRSGIALWPAPAPFGRGAASGRLAFFPTAFFLENGVDEATQRPMLSGSRNLIVRDDRTLLPGSKAGATADQADRSSVSSDVAGNDGPTISLRGRDLRYAIFDRSDLHGADFALADLAGASFRGTNLQRSKFGCVWQDPSPLRFLWAKLSRSQSFPEQFCTELDRANLSGADLGGAEFRTPGSRMPSLKGVKFAGARLDLLDLSDADLGLADLTGASLVGANLANATLAGASLAGADLTAADLSLADLGLAALNDAVLNGADLIGARLVAAEMSSASLVAADLSGAILTGTRLKGAHLWLTSPPQKKDLAWADLSVADLKEPSGEEIGKMKKRLELIGAVITSAVEPVNRLRAFVQGDTPDEKLQRSNEIWSEWAPALSRSAGDLDYRKALVQILSDAACSDRAYSEAILGWEKDFYDSDYYETVSGDRIALPGAPVDPAIGKLKDACCGEDFDLGWAYVIPTPVSPVPDWFDLKPLAEAIKAGKCSASKTLPVDFVSSLERFMAEAAERKARGASLGRKYK